MSEQQQPPAGWGPPPSSPKGPEVRAGSDPKPPFYRRGWFPLVTFLAGAVVGVGGAGGAGQQQAAAPVTSWSSGEVFTTRLVFEQ
jgi:hypothetical protein